MPWASKKEEAPVPYPNPVKIAATWTPDSLVQSGRTPTRGFGGRIFFYDERSRPVPVEGSLIVHGFDDLAESPEKRVKRFEFTPEQFTRHFSQTDLGASYSVWIPWDAVGGEQRRITLVASFKTAEGKMVQGLPAALVLPGRTTEDAEAATIAKFSPQYREYLEATQSGATRSSGLTTTTIPRRSSIRSNQPAIAGKPGITIPTLRDSESKMAAAKPTPSADLEMAKKPGRRSAVMPVSAQGPLRR